MAVYIFKYNNGELRSCAIDPIHQEYSLCGTGIDIHKNEDEIEFLGIRKHNIVDCDYCIRIINDVKQYRTNENIKRYQGVKPPFTQRTLMIRYDHHFGGQLKDRGWWTASWSDTNELYDHHKKDHLIQKAKEKGYRYAVVRIHRNVNECSIIDANFNLKDI